MSSASSEPTSSAEVPIAFGSPEENRESDSDTDSEVSEEQPSEPCSTCENGHGDREDIGRLSTRNLCPCCFTTLRDFSRWVAITHLPITYDEMMIFGGSTIESEKFPHHVHDIHLSKAVDDYGCRICWIVLHTPPREDYPISGKSYFQFDYLSDWRRDDFAMKIAGLHKYVPLDRVEVNDFDPHHDKKATTKKVPSYDASFSMARQWIDECQQFHPKCNASVPRRVNPTRLLCIRGNTVRICSGKSVALGTTYATLSHCWGDLELLTLTSETLESLQRGIEPYKLCKTFNDAIEIARTFGLEYLWIDSLCIIQDNLQDWAKEAASMADVYGQSTLNITASSAPDGSEGCFFDRAPLYLYNYEMQLSINGECSLYRFQQKPHPLYYEQLFNGQALSNRAWAIQERVLPARNLHFTRFEILWECRTRSASERYPTNISSQSRFISYFKHEALSWSMAVNLYTKANLTKGRDKLVAFAGIAKSFPQQQYSEYYAGMWNGRYLMPSLNWSTMMPLDERPREYRAPSWSWAAVDGPIVFTLLKINAPSGLDDSNIPVTHLAKVISIWVQPVGEDRFCEISGGILTLETSVIFCISLHILSKSPRYTDRNYLVRFPSMRDSRGYEISLNWDTKTDAQQSNIVLLPLLLYDGLHWPPYSFRPICGIAVVLVDSDKRFGRYRRVASFYSAELTNEILGSVSEGLGELQEEYYTRSFVDADGKKRYVVEIE